MLTYTQVSVILKDPFFSAFFTENLHNYAFYRGRTNAKCYTLRFNLHTAWFTQERMLNTIIQKVLTQFGPRSLLIGMINYDLLLVKENQGMANSYYCWRANSNQRYIDLNEETELIVTEDNLYLFAQNALQFHLTDLNVHFVSSNVTIDECLAIVFTFVQFSP